ncbi:hypothetical protein LQW54_006122 [Pestalotiopsis sp. IQ-011]
MFGDHGEEREAISEQDRVTVSARASLSNTSTTPTAGTKSSRPNDQDDSAQLTSENAPWAPAGMTLTDHQLLIKRLAGLPAAISSNTKDSDDASSFDTTSWDGTSNQPDNPTAAQLYPTQEIDVDMERNAITTESASDSDIQEIMMQLGFSSADSSI